MGENMGTSHKEMVAKTKTERDKETEEKGPTSVDRKPEVA
jgi:hypothetical protein